MLSHSRPNVSTPPPSSGVACVIDEQVARGERTLSLLGKRLLEARRKIEECGVPLLDDGELEREKAERRGGVERG